MKSAFPGHFANDPRDLQNLWEGCLIALDANVLLSLYRYSEGTRAEFLDVFEKLKDRLWISHQVGKEYLRNRLKVISDQAKTYDAAIQGLMDLRQNFDNPKQHPFVSAEVLGDCTRSFDLIVGELKANKDRHDKKINDDDIKISVSSIFEGRVGPPYNSARLEEIILEGAVRYTNKTPPGFKDASKGGGVSLEDRLAPYGDYIGWLQLIDKARADGRDVIYVTGDNKDDWWLKQSGKTLGPLPELIDEFVDLASQRFYMYLPDRFLEQAGEYLKQTVSTQAMEEAREVRIDESKIQSANDEIKNQIRDYDGDLRWASTYDIEAGDLHSSGWLGRLGVKERLKLLYSNKERLSFRLFELEAELAQRLVGESSEQHKGVSTADLEDEVMFAKERISVATKSIVKMEYLMKKRSQLSP